MGLRPKPAPSRVALRRNAVRAVVAGLVLLASAGIAILSSAGCHASARPASVSPPAAPASAQYDAPGSGHLLRAVAENGRFLTLEDGSRWEIHPRDRFRTAEWEPDSSISVRTTRPDDGYSYEIVNTSVDDSAPGRLVSR